MMKLLSWITMIFISSNSIPQTTPQPTENPIAALKSDPPVLESRENLNFFFAKPNESLHDRLQPECQGRPVIQELYQKKKREYSSCLNSDRFKRKFQMIEHPESHYSLSSEVTLPEAIVFLTKLQFLKFVDPWVLTSDMQSCWEKVGDFVSECIPGAKKLKAFLDTVVKATGGPENDGEPTKAYMRQLLACFFSQPVTSESATRATRFSQCINDELFADKDACRVIWGLSENCVQESFNECEKHPDLKNKTVSTLRKLHAQVGCSLIPPVSADGEVEAESKTWESSSDGEHEPLTHKY